MTDDTPEQLDLDTLLDQETTDFDTWIRSLPGPTEQDEEAA